MKAALVILAAGMGSRYGGEKQTDGIGPGGEILMEYSIFDALRAGFSKVVFIIKPEMLGHMKALCGDALEKRAEVGYAFQDFSSVPDFYAIPPERVKPFGTVHALLCARKLVSEPFVVINADDYYGVSAYKTIFDKLCSLPEAGEAAMVGYRLKNTVSENGTVTRGVCAAENGFLTNVTETYNIAPAPDGSIKDGGGASLDPDSVVSMNFWGFMPSFFGELDAYFNDFLKNLPAGELKREALLPAMVDERIKSGKMRVSVLSSDARWFGMTYHEDKETVRQELLRLHEAGVYPPTLK